jgi:transposase-like protein
MCATSRSWLAIGVNANGYRDVLGVVEGGKEYEASWKAFLRRLKQRGFTGGEAVHLRQVLGQGEGD